MLRTGFAARTAFAGLCALTTLSALPGAGGGLAENTSGGRHEDFKLIADDGESGDSFGIAVSIDGNTVLVGARYDDHDGGDNAGSAYLFDATTGQQLRKLTLDNGEIDFGRTVALEDTTAMIGANNGVYLFDTATGQQLSELTFSALSQSGQRFHRSKAIALAGNTALVGRTQTDSLAPGVHVFDITDPAQPVETTALYGFASHFGSSVALDGNIVLIGADSDNALGFGSNTGSAFLYDLTDPAHPVQLSKLIASDAAEDDRFGTSVALEGNVAIVGTEISGGPGRAYVFDITDPTHPIEVAKLTASDGFKYDRFGFSVATNGNTVIIGADNDDDDGSRSGSAYLFDVTNLNNIVEIAKLTASDARAYKSFGVSVAMDGGAAVVGAWGQGGSAYVFTVPEPAALLLLVSPVLWRRRAQRA